MPFIGSLGGACGYGRAPSSANSGVYISRAEFIDSVIDVSGNIWFTCQSITSIGNLNIGLYNKLGKLVQEVTLETTGIAAMFLVYVSADGISSLWMRRIDGPNSGKIVLDSLKNIYITGYLFANYGLTVYDAFGVAFYTRAANAYQTFYLIKYSASGAPSWVGTSINSVGGAYSSLTIANMKLDSLGNPIIIMSVNPGASIQNIQFRVGTTFTDTTFGTNIAITANQVWAIIVKYNTNGESVSSWAAYIQAVQANPLVLSNLQTESLLINSQNEIICTGRYTGAGGAIVRDSSNNQIGPNLLMSSTVCSYTFIVKFGTNGRAATSWRVGLYCYTTASPLTTLLRQENVPASIFLDSSDNIYCVGFSGARTNTYTFAAVNTTNGLTDNVNFAITAGVCNMFIVKYSNAGTPLWASSIRGTGTTTSATVFNNGVDYLNININPTNTFAGLDGAGNVFVVSLYKRNSISLYTGTTQRGVTLSTSVNTQTTNVNDMFIARISADNSMGYITKIATTVTADTSTDFITPFYILTSSGDLYLYFNTRKISLGLYLNGDNVTPSITLSNPNRQSIAAVCKYNYELSNVTVGYLTSSVATLFPLTPVFMCFDLSGNVIIRGSCPSGSATAGLQLQLYNFGSTVPNIAQTVGTDTTGRASFLAKLTLDSSNSGLIRKVTRAHVENNNVLYSTRAIENITQPNNNNTIYNIDAYMTNYSLFNSQNSRYLSYTPPINAQGLFIFTVPPTGW
jgi:hypothetical protein